MNIALIGYGAMGKLVEQQSIARGHEVCTVIDGSDAELPFDVLTERIGVADVAIDFSDRTAVERNVKVCVEAGVPLVEGTTGWNEDLNVIEKIVSDGDGALIYGANFSIGVNLFYLIAEHAADLFGRFSDYEPFIEEQHHSRKKDSPSGTALRLKNIVSPLLPLQPEIAVTRAGNIPGTHRIGFDGPFDQILLEHTARSRDGFAAGAIVAAEWIAGKRGVFEFSCVFADICRR